MLRHHLHLPSTLEYKINVIKMFLWCTAYYIWFYFLVCLSQTVNPYCHLLRAINLIRIKNKSVNTRIQEQSVLHIFTDHHLVPSLWRHCLKLKEATWLWNFENKMGWEKNYWKQSRCKQNTNTIRTFTWWCIVTCCRRITWLVLN